MTKTVSVSGKPVWKGEGGKEEDMIMRKRQMLTWIAAAALGMSLLSGCSKNSDSKSAETTGSTETSAQSTSDTKKSEDGGLKVVREAVMSNNLDQWLAIVGTEKGFFEDEGIKLEVTEFAAGINTVDAIVTGQADIGDLADYAAVNRIGNTQDKTNLRILFRLAQGTGSALYVNPDKVKDLSDLAGQGFLTLPGTAWDYWNAVTYEKAGIPADQQNLVRVDSSQAALAVMTTGQGVAFWAGGVDAKKLEEAGMKALVSMDEIGLYTDQYLISSTEYLAQNPETVESFVKAVKTTQEWVEENTDEAAGILENKLKVPKQQFIDKFENYKMDIDFPEDAVEHFDGIKAWAIENGKFAKDYDLKDFTDLTAIKKLYPDKVAE